MIEIFLSPSTQDTNQYAGGGTGITDSEEYWCRICAKEVKAELERTGKFKCYIGGTTSAAASAAASNAQGVNSHVAIHTNAGGGEGSEVWYYTGSAGGKKLADSVYYFVARESNQPDRGVKSSTKYIELNSTKAEAIIVEILFHDDKTEAQEMRTDHKKFAVAIAKGICRRHGVVYVPATAPVTPKPPTTPTTPTVDPCAAVKAELAETKTKLATATVKYDALVGKLRAITPPA